MYASQLDSIDHMNMHLVLHLDEQMFGLHLKESALFMSHYVTVMFMYRAIYYFNDFLRRVAETTQARFQPHKMGIKTACETS